MALAVWTISQISENLRRGGVMWEGVSIKFGFPTSAPTWSRGEEAAGFSTATSAQKTMARMAVTVFDDVIAADFIEVASRPNVTFQNTSTAIGYAHAYFPQGGAESGSIWFNSKYTAAFDAFNDLMTPTLGSYGYSTYIHELGHALGLDHPGDYPDRDLVFSQDAAYRQDTTMYTVMSYFGAENSGADHIASDGEAYFAQTLMMHDIKALHDLYGAETTTRTGNTVYGFRGNTGSTVYDFSQNKHPVLCIWDAGGNDTLNLSGFRTASRIDLRAGTFSDCDAMTKNISIAIGAVIENAVGGAGHDSILGNGYANRLEGGAGNDKLEGHRGHDTLIGGTGRDEFIFKGVGLGNDTIKDFEDGLDKLVFSTAIADAFSDFTVTGNNSTSVSLAVGNQSILLQDDVAIRLSTADFLFV